MAICVLLVGCNHQSRCVFSCDDCNENESCVNYISATCPHGCIERNFSNHYYKINETKEDNTTQDSGIPIPEECPEGQHKWLFSCISDDMYCYQDNSKGTHCDCDILTFPDGHNETRNCYCWNDLVMYYTCINLTEENITVVKDIKI